MRVALLSLRDERSVPWFGGILDAEDALARAMDAPVHRVVPAGRLSGGALGSDHVKRALSWTRVVRPHRLRRDPHAGTDRADVLVVVVNDLHDAGVLMAVPGWEDLGEVVVMHMSETNLRDMRLRPEVVMHLRKRVDALFVSAPGPWMERLPGRRLRTVGCVPVLLDVLAFAPRPAAHRPIDVLNLGRRHPGQHAQLLRWAERVDGFYLHDTGYLGSVSSLHEHRDQYRGLACHSRAFVTNFARFDQDADPRGFGARVLGARFYEAMSAGCVLVGDLPREATQFAQVAPAEPIHWSLEAESVPGELIAVLGDDDELDRRARAGRSAALSTVDVAHRWQQMAAAVGLPDHPGIVDRLAELRRRAGAPAISRSTGTAPHRQRS